MLAGLCAWTGLASARAQGIADMFAAGPNVSLEGAVPVSADDGGSVGYGRVSVGSPFWWQPKGEWRAFAGFDYDLTRVEWKGGEGRSLTGHAIALPLDVLWLPGAVEGRGLDEQKWFGWMRVSPSLYSDLSQVSGSDVGLSAIMAVGWRPVREWVWVGGAYFSRELGEPRLLPAVGFVWTPNEAWTLALLPPRAALTWKPSEAWRLALVVQPAGGNWAVEETGEGRGYYGLSVFTGTVDVERRFGKNLRAFGSIGAAFAGEVRTEDTDRNEVDSTRFGPAPFVRVGMKLAF